MKYKTAVHDNYCTYLNYGLLEAPREYVLHGLVPGLNWAPFWPHPWACILLPRPTRSLAVNCNSSSFTPSTPLLYGWLLTKVQANITTTLHNTWHTCIYIKIVSLFILLSVHLPFFWAGWLPPTRTVCYKYKLPGFAEMILQYTLVPTLEKNIAKFMRLLITQ